MVLKRLMILHYIRLRAVVILDAHQTREGKLANYS